MSINEVGQEALESYEYRLSTVSTHFDDNECRLDVWDGIEPQRSFFFKKGWTFRANKSTDRIRVFEWKEYAHPYHLDLTGSDPDFQLRRDGTGLGIGDIRDLRQPGKGWEQVVFDLFVADLTCFLPKDSKNLRMSRPNDYPGQLS